MSKETAAITFDAGGTLLHTRPSPGAIYARVAARHGLRVEPARMERAFRETWEEVHDAGLVHETADQEGMRYWRRIVYRTLERVGGMDDPEPCFLELYEMFADPALWHLEEGAVEVLREARDRGCAVGLVSNWDSRLRGLLEGLGLIGYFDAIVISCEIGVEKPHPAIFHAALREMGVRPEETVHIGDSYRDDVIGARRAGISPIWLLRDGAFPAGGCATARTLREAFSRAVNGSSPA